MRSFLCFVLLLCNDFRFLRSWKKNKDDDVKQVSTCYFEPFDYFYGAENPGVHWKQLDLIDFFGLFSDDKRD